MCGIVGIKLRTKAAEKERMALNDQTAAAGRQVGVFPMTTTTLVYALIPFAMKELSHTPACTLTRRLHPLNPGGH
jgi:hypothetical protein